MKTVLFFVSLFLALPAQAQLGHFLGGVADSREGRQGRTERELDAIQRDAERRQQQMQLNRLERQNEEMSRIIREMESRERLERFRHKR